MPIGHAEIVDLPEIVAIYNASIRPDGDRRFDPVSVTDREGRFDSFDPAKRPLWVYCNTASPVPLAWLSLRSFYGRPAYDGTVETS